MERFVVRVKAVPRPRKKREKKRLRQVTINSLKEVEKLRKDAKEQEANGEERPQRRPPKKNDKQDKKLLRQATIGAMKKVVPVKEVNELSQRMREHMHDPDTLLECLNRLTEKIFEPSVLLKLDVGRVVRRLTKHQNPKVAQAAKALKTEWTARIQAPPKPLLEVKAGGKDETVRRGFRQMIAKPLRGHAEHTQDATAGEGGGTDLCDERAKQLEVHVFRSKHEDRPSAGYKRTCRQLSRMLTYNADIAHQVLDGSLLPSTVVAVAVQWSVSGKVELPQT
ncbi:hypothetical protein PTSG_11687 [Salpingoeca rosetta]|uniref:TFIIS N-terminal domain-containing protein n=1 Tax=Salpingoeca rosetta (strain ATCC 50818 / BSB-021) TaxID=946362 RepID=F2U0S3_SALR5|nr:uncharacterized protein PTSG_11687 [Salpingoeca rosetta]EGD80497.1 hypothetical protein PTSG_11687 [Salpingoeca rosetta]|eukprot:XP_004997058.1 hypothetical protein PTSG_11687 [Salpingoeca rosetta]